MIVALQRIPCPLCGSDGERFLFEGRDRLHGTPGRFPMVQCTRCNLAYLNPQPGGQDLARAYPEDYFSHKDDPAPRKGGLRRKLRDWVLCRYFNYPGPGEANSLGILGRLLALPLRLLFHADRRNSLVIPYQGQGRFLDVGCGRGGTLSQMARGGWQVTGMDTDRKMADRLNRETDHTVFAGEIEDMPFHDESFDVAHLSHVLEHLPRPAAALKKIHDLLVPGGRLYLRVPDRDSFTAGRYNEWWIGYDVPRHLCNYTQDTARSILENSGFIIEYIKGDRNFSGLRRTLLLKHGDAPSCLTHLARARPIMAAFQTAITLFSKLDVMIISAQKPKH
jgi:SAM-dependent methyltransferase